MARFSNITKVAAALAAIAMVVTGCADSENGDGEGASSDEPIVIGGTLGLTGTYSGPSAAYKAAYEYWAEEVNGDGGVLGRPVELKIYDDESEPTTAQQLYERLINDDQVDFLLAPYTTAVGGAVVPITERAGKILFNAGFVSQRLHSSSELLVTSWKYQEPEYSLPVFEYLKTLPEAERPKTLAVATAQNPFTIVARDGEAGSGGVLEYAEDLGMDVVFNEEYNQAATDLTSLVRGAKDSGAEVFIALSLPNDGALMARTVQQVDYRPTYYCQCGSQVVTLPTWKDLGPAGNNVLSTTLAWPGTPDHPGLDGLFEHLQAEFDYEVMPAYGAGALAILQVLEQAVEGAESTDQEEVRAYIGENEFQTAVGTLKYEEDGTAEFGALLVQQQQDGVKVGWPEEVATGDVVAPLR